MARGQVRVEAIDGHRFGIHLRWCPRASLSSPPWYPKRRLSGLQQRLDHRVPATREIAAVVATTAQRQQPAMTEPVRQRGQVRGRSGMRWRRTAAGA